MTRARCRPLLPLTIAVLVLHFLLFVELPTDFLEADARHVGDTGYARWLEIVSATGAPRRQAEGIVHEAAGLALLLALLRLGVGRTFAWLAFAAAILSPALTGAAARRLQPTALTTSLALLSLALALHALASTRARAPLLVAALLVAGGAALLGAPLPFEAARQDALTLEAEWLTASGSTPRLEVEPAVRARFESALGEPLMRDRVRLPDASVFLEGLALGFRALLWVVGPLAVVCMFLRPSRRPRCPRFLLLAAVGTALVAGGTGIVIAAVLAPVWAYVALDGIIPLPSRQRGATVLGWLLLAAIVLPNFVDLPSSAFVGRRILPHENATYRVDTGGREYFVGTDGRALELMFPRAIDGRGRILVLEVDAPGLAPGDPVVVTVHGGAGSSERHELRVGASPWRVPVAGVQEIRAVAVSDAADHARLIWRRMRVE